MSFLPSLSHSDIEQAAQLIQQAYAPPSSLADPDTIRRLQHELFEIQKRPEAWGLVIPLLDHQDQNVQFFGAHTAQVKIARDWESFPPQHVEALRDLLVQLTAHSAAKGRNKFILRKQFVALTSLALKLAPGHPSRWPDWILACASAFSAHGAPAESIHDFLEIVAEEVGSADLLGGSKAQMQQTLLDAAPMVVGAITATISQPPQAVPPREMQAALKCLQAWIGILRASDLTPLPPLLLPLLDPSYASQDPIPFLAASDALQELLSKSSFGGKVLTEPLLFWLDGEGRGIVERMVVQREKGEEVGEVEHSLCKLLVALGDHSTGWLASNIASPALCYPPVGAVAGAGSSTPGAGSSSSSSSSSTVSVPIPTLTPKSKSHLTQSFLQLLLAFTGLAGFYGIDEEESEATLGFWYLFQEALWGDDGDGGDGWGDDGVGAGVGVGVGGREGGVGEQEGMAMGQEERETEQVRIAKAVYIELVKVLRRKVAFPPAGVRWSKDQVDKFQVYRRDVGDTLINAYYVLRDDMLAYYIGDIEERLEARREGDGWEDIEATLHCILSIQEALDLENSPLLARLFSPHILGRLPATGHARIRRTTLGVIGTYASWFTSHPSSSSPSPSSSSSSSSSQPNLLLSVLAYVVSALTDPSLCLQAAVALRNLCDANRKALAPHVAAFGELHAGVGGIPDSEKSKVLQSIASVIQALPPDEEIPPIEGIVCPIVQKLVTALQSSTALPDEARTMAILQLEILSGVSKGLTRNHDVLGSLEDNDPTVREEMRKVEAARADLRMIKLREEIFAAVRSVVDIWSSDAGINHALSDLFKSITCLPMDLTLISLPAGPLLELVCLATQRQLTAAWLSLASILIAQLNPPSFSYTVQSGPTPEAEGVVASALPILLQCALGMLALPGAMESNPDIVQEFFGCMDRVAQDFTNAFCNLPPGALDALMQCAISALSLQERYSLVAACTFVSTLIHRFSLTEETAPRKNALLAMHGKPLMRAVLQGFAAVAPRSAVPNLIEILGTLLTRASGIGPETGGGAGQWMKEILFSDDFVPSKAGPEAKERFLKAVAGSRSLKKTRDAANQFTLIARGLEGSSFGYASVSM